MKVTWEAHDIRPGTIVRGYKKDERWMIGYNAAEASGSRYAFISLTDGMISVLNMPKDEVVNLLNDGDYYPEKLADLEEKNREARKAFRE